MSQKRRVHAGGAAGGVEVAVLAGHLGAEDAVGGLDPLELLLGEQVRSAEAVGAVEAVHDVAVDHARPQGALALLAADDRRVALEPGVGVGQPVAVVGVDHPVPGGDVGQVRRAQRAGAGGVVVAAPGAVGRCAGAVEAGQAGQLEQHAPDRRHALLDLVRGHVRHHGVVRVQRVAVAVRRDGVDPRHAGGLVLGGEQLADRVGPPHLEEHVERAQVLGVGVTEGPHAGRRPAHQQVRGVQHEALVGRPQVLGGGGAVGQLDLDLAALDLLHAPVGGRVGRVRARHQPVLVGGEAVRGRDGVGPGDVLVEADVDHRRAVQHGPVHVVLTGDAQVALREAVAALPREVRVAQHHPAPRRGGVGAQRGAVGAEGGLGVLAQPGAQLVGRGQLVRGRARRTGRRRWPRRPARGHRPGRAAGRSRRTPTAARRRRSPARTRRRRRAGWRRRSRGRGRWARPSGTHGAPLQAGSSIPSAPPTSSRYWLSPAT